MSTVEDALPWISSPDTGPLSRVSLTRGLAGRAPGRCPPARWRPAAGRPLLAPPDRQRRGGRAEGEAIRRALAATLGNKSHAARLLRTNYTTLHGR